jgi:hypothetical protein
MKQISWVLRGWGHPSAWAFPSYAAHCELREFLALWREKGGE